MQEPSFTTSAHGKCILAGEHSVVRGAPALIAPLPNKILTLTYTPNENPIDVENHAMLDGNFLILFWDIFYKSMKILDKHLFDIHGKFYLENKIQIGAGLGFSAALCVVVTRWLIWEHWLNTEKLFPFAQRLENVFHGKSSGADIAGALSDHLVHFEKSGNIHEVNSKWKPKLYLSYSGIMRNTSEAFNKVTKIRKENPRLAKLIDTEMRDSVLQIEKALNTEEEEGFSLFVSAIQHANHCFSEWGLIPLEVQHHMDQLQEWGAVAVKPTGAGAGGYVLSLWKHDPDKQIPLELLRL